MCLSRKVAFVKRIDCTYRSYHRVRTESWILKKVLKFVQLFSRPGKSLKSGKMIKSHEFFFFFVFFFDSYSTSSACLQRCAPRKKLCSYVLRSLLITCLITVSLEKEVIVWKKFWKKSWILDPKICVNPVTSSSRDIFFRWFFFSTISPSCLQRWWV